MDGLFPFLLMVGFISLSGVMMPGPVLTVTIAKGYRERTAGASIAVGHGFVEVPLMVLIYLGFAYLFENAVIRNVISLGGGAMLAYMGYGMIRSRGSIVEEGRDLAYGSVTAGILTTSANPYFFLWWATVGAKLIMDSAAFGLLGFGLFMAVHWTCDLLWGLFVSWTVHGSRRFWTPMVHGIVFGGCGVILVVFGLWFVSSIF